MATIRGWRVWCDTDSRWEEVFLPDGTPPSTCPTDTAHTIDTAKSLQISGTLDLIRLHPEDGSIITKRDPGTADTDPKYIAKQFTTPAASGLAWFHLAASGVRLQEVVIQVRNGVFMDTVEIALCSDGTVPAYGPDGTVLKSYGAINIPMQKDAAGWSPRIREPEGVGTSVLIPPGMKACLGYDSSNTTSQDLAVDVVTQE